MGTGLGEVVGLGVGVCIGVVVGEVVGEGNGVVIGIGGMYSNCIIPGSLYLSFIVSPMISTSGLPLKYINPAPSGKIIVVVPCTVRFTCISPSTVT